LKNKTTYEMEDVMNLIAKDLADKGLAPDPGSIVIRAIVAGTEVRPSGVEIDVNVSWVGISAQDDGESPAPRARLRRAPEPDVDVHAPPPDLLDEAPRPGAAPALEIGIDEVTAAGAKIARTGGAGPFAPERVKRRLSQDESYDWPSSSSPRGR
jgi:hypothetical protein